MSRGGPAHSGPSIPVIGSIPADCKKRSGSSHLARPKERESLNSYRKMKESGEDRGLDPAEDFDPTNTWHGEGLYTRRMRLIPLIV